MSTDRLREEGMIDEVKGNVKETVGRATGDASTEAEGKLDEVTGNIKQGLADVKDKIDDTVQDIADR